MENTPSFDNEPPAPPIMERDKPDKDKKEKKKNNPFEASADKRRQAEDIGRSIFERPVKAEKSDKSDNESAEKLRKAAPETDSVTPDAHDDGYSQQQIGENHHKQLQASDIPADERQPAEDYVQDLADEKDNDESFRQHMAEAGADEPEIDEAIAETQIPDSEMAESDNPDDGEDQPESGEDATATETVTENEPETIDTAEVPEGEIPIQPVTTPQPAGGNSAANHAAAPASTSHAASGRPVLFSDMRPKKRLPSAAADYYENRYVGGDVLLGGIVGYLVGRRRGRIKAEKRLKPVQHRLEKRVNQLERQISQREQILIATKARSKERAAEKTPPAVKETVVKEVPTTKSRQESPVYVPAERTQPGLKETRLDMQKPARAEQLGHLLVAAEAPAVERVRVERPNNIREAFRLEEVKTMHRAELLELSEKIVVEGANLRRIYESRLIGEKQLRHLVGEYLQGKDIRKDLRREMIEREIDFERDPILRDRVRTHLANSQDGGGLGKLLASVGIVEEENDPIMQHRVEREAARQAAQDKRHHRQQLAADAAMVTAIVVLALAVVVLALRH